MSMKLKFKCIDSWLNSSDITERSENTVSSSVFNITANANNVILKLKLNDNTDKLCFTDNNLKFYEFKANRGLEYEFSLNFSDDNSHNIRIYGAECITEFHALGSISLFKSSANNNLVLLDLHDNLISKLDISTLKHLQYLHIFGNPIVDNKSNIDYLYKVMKDLPDRNNLALGSIVLYPWYGLETLVYFSDGTRVGKDTSQSIANNTTSTATATLINSSPKVDKYRLCKYPARLQFRGKLDPNKGLKQTMRDSFYYDKPIDIKMSSDNSNQSILYAFAVPNYSTLINSARYGVGYQHKDLTCALLDLDDANNKFGVLNTIKISTTKDLNVGDTLELLNGDSAELLSAVVVNINNDYVTIAEPNKSTTLFNTFKFNTKWFVFNKTYTNFGDRKFNYKDYNQFQCFSPEPSNYGLVYATYDYTRNGWRVHELTYYNYLRVFLEDRYCTKKNWYFGSAIQYSESDWNKCFHYFREFGCQDVWESTQKGFGQTVGVFDFTGGMIDGDWKTTTVWDEELNILRFQDDAGLETEPYTIDNKVWLGSRNAVVGHGDSVISMGASRGHYAYGICPNASIYAIDDVRNRAATSYALYARLFTEMYDFVDSSTRSIAWNSVSKGGLSGMRFADNKAGERIPILQSAGNDGDGLMYNFDTSVSGNSNLYPYTMHYYNLGSRACQNGRWGFISDRDETSLTNLDDTSRDCNTMLVHAVSKDYMPSSFTNKSTDAKLLKASYKNYINGFGDMAIIYRAAGAGYGKFNGTSCATPVACFQLMILKNLYHRKFPNYLGNYGLKSKFMDYVRHYWVNPMNNMPCTVSGAGSFSVKYPRQYDKPDINDVNLYCGYSVVTHDNYLISIKSVPYCSQGSYIDVRPYLVVGLITTPSFKIYAHEYSFNYIYVGYIKLYDNGHPDTIYNIYITETTKDNEYLIAQNVKLTSEALIIKINKNIKYIKVVKSNGYFPDPNSEFDYKIQIFAKTLSNDIKNYYFGMPFYKNTFDNIIMHPYNLVAVDEDTNNLYALQPTQTIQLPVSYTNVRFNSVNSDDDYHAISETAYVYYDCASGYYADINNDGISEPVDTFSNLDIIRDDSFNISKTVSDASDMLYEFTEGALGIKDQVFTDCDEFTIQLVLNYELESTTTKNAVIGFYFEELQHLYQPLVLSTVDYSVSETQQLKLALMSYYATRPRDPEQIAYMKEHANKTLSDTVNFMSETILYGKRCHYNEITDWNYSSSTITKSDYSIYDFGLSGQRNVMSIVFKDRDVTYYLNGNRIRTFLSHRPMTLGRLTVVKNMLDSTAKTNVLIYPRKLSNKEIIQNTITLLNQKETN